MAENLLKEHDYSPGIFNNNGPSNPFKYKHN